MSEARKDNYSSFGVVEPCIILDSAQNVIFDEDQESDSVGADIAEGKDE